MGLLRDLRPGIERTKRFIETLLSLKLIEPMTSRRGFDDGTKRELTGLYTVNRDQLQELPMPRCSICSVAATCS